MDQLFDELSVHGGFADKHSAHQAMLQMWEASRALEALGFASNIHTTRDFKLRELAPNFSVQHWFLDREIAEREKRLLFLARCSKAAYLEELLDQAAIPGDVEYLCRGEKTYGLTLGLLWGCPVLSLTEEWSEACRAALLKKTLLESGTIQEETLYVLAVRSAPDVQAHREEIRNEFCAHIHSGQDILDCPLFLHLEFCQSARHQLVGLCGAEQFFPEILRHLQVLEESILADIFRPWGIDYASRESESTMNNAQCRQAHTFVCPDGESRLFWEHSKIHSANKRIYFLSDCVQHKILVGHIGDHLPVSSW